MAYDKIKVPAGEKITLKSEGVLDVPDQPVITYIEGDGIGPDITKASMHIWNSRRGKSLRRKTQNRVDGGALPEKRRTGFTARAHGSPMKRSRRFATAASPSRDR